MGGFRLVIIDGRNRSEYESLLASSMGSSINQSLDWGLTQERVGRESFALAVVRDRSSVNGSYGLSRTQRVDLARERLGDRVSRNSHVNSMGDEVILTALITKHRLPFGYTYLYVNNGPHFHVNDYAAFDFFCKEMKKIAREFRSIFLRVDPPFLLSQKTINAKDRDRTLVDFGQRMRPTFFSERGFVPAHSTYQPHDTLVLDTSYSLDDMLSNMKPKGRYNIKVGEKKGVECTTYWDDGEHVDEFVRLMRITTARDGFSGHPTLYYKTLMEFLGPRKKCALVLAKYEGQVICGAMVTFFGQKATYYYGASDNAYRNVMAPYLVQWKSVLLAKEQGCRFYDFLGIAPADSSERGYDQSHRFAKITEFKEKFGGFRVEYIGSWEFVYQPLLYRGLLSLKKVRGLLRS